MTQSLSRGAGLKIWISWEVHNHVTMKPTYKGKTTLEKARQVYGIEDPQRPSGMLRASLW